MLRPVLALVALAPPAAAQVPVLDLPAGSTGTYFLDRYASALTPVDDIDGDGHDELAILIGNENAVRIVSGRWGEPLLTFGLSEVPSDMAPIPDFDGDAIGDLVIGFPGYDVGGTDRGLVRIYSSVSGLQLGSFVGADAGDRLGERVLGLPDVTGDGVPDVAAGAPGHPVDGIFGPSTGEVRTFSGSDGSLVSDFNGGSGADGFGALLDQAGDFDGDGDLDLVASSFNRHVRVFDPVADELVYHPFLGNPLFPTIEDVAGVGDIDGDGRPEIVVGCPRYETFFENNSVVWICDVAGQEDGIFASIDDEYGHDIEPIGDWNGDGKPDFAVLGLAWAVWAGGPGYLSEAGIGLPGSCLAAAGDPDRDGHDELWIGTPLSDTYALNGGRLRRFERDAASSIGAKVTLELGGWRRTAGVRSSDVMDDLDGDGRAEVVVGAPFEEPASDLDQGAVRVFSGATVLVEVFGQQYEQLGYAVAALGDVDGDGKADLVAGAPNSVVGQGVRGRAYVLSGADGSVLRQHFGAGAGERFGAAVTRVPDVDGDQIDDYAVGAPRALVGGLRVGRAHVYSGATGTLVRSLDGSILNENFGASLAGSTDLDGDGLGDLLVGAPAALAGFFGPARGRVDRVSVATGAKLGMTTGVQNHERFGSSLVSLGDVDGDGVSDWAAGAPYHVVGVGPGGGRFEVRSGANGSVLVGIGGALDGELGGALAVLGDVDVDGVPDFAVGAPNWPDLADSSITGLVQVFSGATLAPIRTVLGEDHGDQFGESLAGGGDVDGDRLRDLVVSVPGADDGTSLDVGAASTWSARAIGSELFGTGTAGCVGPHLLALAKSAEPGDPVELRIGGLAPGLVPVLLVSLNAYEPGVDLGLGALAHVLPPYPVFKFQPPTTGAFATNGLNIPNDSSLEGVTFHVQETWIDLAPCPELPLGYSTTNGLSVTIQ